MSGKEKRRRRNWLFSLRRYLTFFVLMAFVITCCMLLFLNTITRATGLELSQAYVEAAAKVTFLNILLLALVCTLIDGLRRKWMVGRPVRKIIKAAEQITQGGLLRPGCRICTVWTPGTALGRLPTALTKWPRSFSGTETLRTDFIANVSHELKNAPGCHPELRHHAPAAGAFRGKAPGVRQGSHRRLPAARQPYHQHLKAEQAGEPADFPPSGNLRFGGAAVPVFARL